MSILRNLFLNTAAFNLGPNDPPGGGDGKTEDGSASNDTNDDAGGADDTSAEGGVDAGDDTGGADDDASGVDDDSDDDAEDDDPDLADLSPEQRKKVAAKIARETTWRDRRIGKLTAKRREAQADNDAMTTILDGQGTRPARAPAAKPGENLTAEQIEQRAKILAGQMSAQDKYDEDCNDANAAGVKDFGKKWNSALANLNKLGNVDVSDMVDILATEQPHVVLFELSDPETYQRIMDLSPAKRRTEFVKLSLKEPPKGKTAESKRPGDARPPVRQVNGGRQVAAQSVDLYATNVDDDAWYKARNETRRKKFTNVA